MSSGYAVDLDLLDAMVDQMVAFQRQAGAVQSDVDARLHGLHAVWTGVAATESATAHAHWATGSYEMHEALAVLRSIASTARANYASAIAANTEMWALG